MWIPILLLSAHLLTGQWPVDNPEVLAGFQPPDTVWGPGHRGIDLAAHTGDPVQAMEAGTVTFTGIVAGKAIVTVGYPGPEHRRSTYEPVIASVAVGQHVAAGDLLGTVAATGGHCGGQHGCLHVGLRTDSGYLDPATLVARVPAVLKPRAGA